MEFKALVQFFALPTLLASIVTAFPIEASSTDATDGVHSLVTRLSCTELANYKPSKVEEESVTDQYLFNLTLDSFITERDQRCPPFLFWESDGCSDSPDHPFGFNYLPACYRHDFGYDQYRRSKADSPKETRKSLTRISNKISTTSARPLVWKLISALPAEKIQTERMLTASTELRSANFQPKTSVAAWLICTTGLL
ncbi:hypothetical protein N0V93_004419 [Gnomoniopsis smithogilvyi]|uniref:Uncharacterized protein n=1 Tax=Gnomoniopsis smithogilvyi TaxID=1191159 RepID=A0A9W8YR17_9PEZI|nr:hypothetical protein N0V93_004419 [Gnomoniopsis smithogilvyi]